MNKNDLIAAIAESTEIDKKDVKAVIDSMTEIITEELKKGEKVQLIGFGTFEAAERGARTGRNPNTGETIQIAASRSPKFKPGKAMKDAINAD